MTAPKPPKESLSSNYNKREDAKRGRTPQPLSGAAQPAPRHWLIPDELWARYDKAVDAAHSTGALKQLKNVEAEIGRLFISRELFREAAPVAVPANFVSDYSLPSCHVCGEMMKGVCPKCGTTTGVVVPAGPSDTLYVVEHKRDGQWRVHQGMNICMTRSFLEHIIIPELTKEFPNHEWRISEYLRSSK